MTVISAYIDLFIRGEKSGGNVRGYVWIPSKTRMIMIMLLQKRRAAKMGSVLAT